MDPQKQQDFESRLSQWASQQGMIYQLINPVYLGKPHFLQKFWSVFSRLLLVSLMIGGIAGWGYYRSHLKSESLTKVVQESFQKVFKAQTVEVQSVRFRKGTLSIPSLQAEGLDHTFFDQISFKVGSTSYSLWKLLGFSKSSPASLKLNTNEAEIELQRHFESEAQAQQAYETLFQKASSAVGVKISRLELIWGGSITNTRLTANRSQERWDVVCEGGAFTQGFLKNIPLERLTLSLEPEGIIKVKELILSPSAGGKIVLKAEIKPDPSWLQPTIKGEGDFEGVDIARFISNDESHYIKGKMNAAFTFTGPINRISDLVYSFKAQVSEEFPLTFSEKNELLTRLTIVDQTVFQPRLIAVKGSYQLEISNKGVRFHDVDLECDCGRILRGDFLARKLTKDEMKDVLGIEDPGPDKAKKTSSLYDDLEGNTDLSIAAGGRHILGAVRDSALSGLANRYVYYGDLSLGMKKEAFEGVIPLQEMFPVDEQGERRWLFLPLTGQYIEEIGGAEEKRISQTIQQYKASK